MQEKVVLATEGSKIYQRNEELVIDREKNGVIAICWYLVIKSVKSWGC